MLSLSRSAMRRRDDLTDGVNYRLGLLHLNVVTTVPYNYLLPSRRQRGQFSLQLICYRPELLRIPGG